MTALGATQAAVVIELNRVTKIYQRFGHRHFATLKSAFLKRSILKDLRPSETFMALDDVSLKVRKGSTFGVIGRNGSGKSTALKLVAGITKPTAGTVTVRGRISALIELGAGFHPEISGRENVYINGIMLGLTKREIDRRFDEIVEFAELRDFIDEPVKNYSSGMYMRLGFSVAVHVDPEVLLVDEVLAVGDEAFTHKCLDKFADFKRRGKTILLVTHSLGLVERFCDEAVWLDGGRRQAEGDSKRVVGAYMAKVQQDEEKSLERADDNLHTVTEQGTGDSGSDTPAVDPTQDMTRVGEGRWGSRLVEISEVGLLDLNGHAAHVFQTGDLMRVHLRVKATRPVDDFVFGVGIFNAEGLCVYGTNTEIENFVPTSLSGVADVFLFFESLDLVEGTYKVDVAVHSRDGVPYDYHRLFYTFRVKSRTKDVGVYRPRHRWEFEGEVSIKPRSSSQD